MPLGKVHVRIMFVDNLNMSNANRKIFLCIAERRFMDFEKKIVNIVEKRSGSRRILPMSILCIFVYIYIFDSV